jgi:DNA adenine methylase
MAEMDKGGLTPFYCRVGSKKYLSRAIVAKIPDHTTYVEPFAGSASVFWRKSPSEKEVLNDLDKSIISDLRLLKKAPEDIEKYPDTSTIDLSKRVFVSTSNTLGAKLKKRLIHRCSGFSGRLVKKPSDIYRGISNRKINNIKKYKDRIKDAILISADYGKIINKYDDTSAFFFLDPPYEKSEKLGGIYAEEKDFDYDRLSAILKKIKGKFLMTINDSPKIRSLFKDFNIKPYLVKRTSEKGIGSKDRHELFISNYSI